MNKPFKFALTGAHGTGKTTLSRSIIDGLNAQYTASATDEVPRLIIDDLKDPYFFRRDNNTFNRQCAILARQLEVEAEAMLSNSEIVVCDRTIADHWAYTCSLFPEEISTVEGSVWFQLVSRWLKTYDLIVRLPCEFPPVDDGVREGALDYQQEIDQVIKSLYQQLEITFVDVVGSVDQRTAACLGLIKQQLATNK